MDKFDLEGIFSNLIFENMSEEMLEEYQVDCDNIMELISLEEKNFDEYFDKYNQRIMKTEYATKSSCIPRGYYCPSKIIDVISNMKRGRLTKPGRHDFVYNYDKDGRLIFVRRNNLKACEFIKYIDDCEIGITFRRRKKIEAISICEFYNDGKIKQYSYYSRDSLEKRSVNLEREIYKYSNNKVEVVVINFLPKDSNCYNYETLFSKRKYTFSKTNEKKFEYISQQIYPTMFSDLKIKHCVQGAYPFD